MVHDVACDFFAHVDCSPIPQQNDWSAQMVEEVPEKPAGVQAGKIARTKGKVEGHTPLFRGHSQSTHGRDPVLLVHIMEQRGMALGCPCPRDVWDEQKAGFIEKYQMSA